jgi:RNA polymerase sigma-70 factor (ECF subfamily)
VTDTPTNRPGAQASARDDRELVAATLAGDQFAFDELVERYQGKIYNLALGVTGNSEDAMDATQGAFLKVYQNLSRFDPAHRLFSWIYRISLNEALNIVNRRRRFSPLDPELASGAAGPEERSCGRETGRAIRETLVELKPDLRVTVVLRHLHGLSYSEMSDVIGVPAKTVKSRLFAARRELRQKLLAKGLVHRKQ